MRKLILILTIAFSLAVIGEAARWDSIIAEYRGVFIGTARDQVHEKLGKPENEFSGEDDFKISDTETVRVFYDDTKKVKAIVITYTGVLDAAPKPKDVIGEPIEPKADRGIYKMVRVEDKGFWVSYVKTAGDNPSIMITVQALKST
jgi:hypothetical protein